MLKKSCLKMIFLLDDVGRHVTLESASSDPVPVL